MKKRYSVILVVILGVYLSAFVNVYPQFIRSSRIESSVSNLGDGKWRVSLSPKDKWFDTNIDVIRGAMINISATGFVTWAPPGGRNMSSRVGPNGTRLPFAEDKNRFPMPDAGCGSLIMRVGNSIYFVGEGGSIKANEPGTIQLMVNDDVLSDNSGGFTVDTDIPQTVFRKPINGGSIACVFDTKECADPNNHHTGIDYWGEGKKATDILASNCGIVSYIQLNNGKDHGLGNAVILKHSVIGTSTGRITTLYTLYAHMNSIIPGLKVGQKVAKGDKLGVMGSTGYGKPNRWGKTPHLHFEVKTESTLSNSAGRGSYWGYTPKSAADYGYFDPADVIGNWQADCSEQENSQSPKTIKSRYSVRIFNVDDSATVYVNGSRRFQSGYNSGSWVDITNELHPGKNEVRFVLRNFQEGFTYGFEIFRDDKSIFRDECGVISKFGCRGSSQIGVVYDRTIIVTVD